MADCPISAMNLDEEHRLGVLMHGTRLVHIGFADVAFVLWRAEQDMKSS